MHTWSRPASDLYRDGWEDVPVQDAALTAVLRYFTDCKRYNSSHRNGRSPAGALRQAKSMKNNSSGHHGAAKCSGCDLTKTAIKDTVLQLVKLYHANEKFLAHSKLATVMENHLVPGKYM